MRLSSDALFRREDQSKLAECSSPLELAIVNPAMKSKSPPSPQKLSLHFWWEWGGSSSDGIKIPESGSCWKLNLLCGSSCRPKLWQLWLPFNFCNFVGLACGGDCSRESLVLVLFADGNTGYNFFDGLPRFLAVAVLLGGGVCMPEPEPARQFDDLLLVGVLAGVLRCNALGLLIGDGSGLEPNR